MEFFIIFLWWSNLFGAQIDHFDWSKGFWKLAFSCRQLKMTLGSELTTFIDGIISKLLFQWGKERFNLNWFFIWRKMKKYNLIYSILKSLYFHNFCRVCCLGKREKKSSHMHICNLEYVWLWLPGFPIQRSDFKSSGWLQGWLSLSSFQGW